MTSSIIIPTLNEEQNIGLLIDKLNKLYKDIEIIVADDGSKDKTLEIAKKYGAIVIDRSSKSIKGITASILDALEAINSKTENIIIMDADLQHPPEVVGNIIKMLESNDLVIAARRKVIGEWGIIRKLQSKFATLLALARLRKNVHDPMSGFFGIKTILFKQIKKENFELPCFKILFNVLKNLDLNKTKMGYVYYDFHMRHGGESKISLRHAYYFLKNVLR